MATSRDANDPREAMAGMRREAHREFESSEARDSGGLEHQSPEEHDGRAGDFDPEAARSASRATRQQEDVGRLATPEGDERSGERGPPGQPPRVREGEEP